jgi:hypothetical protein
MVGGDRMRSALQELLAHIDAERQQMRAFAAMF